MKVKAYFTASSEVARLMLRKKLHRFTSLFILLVLMSNCNPPNSSSETPMDWEEITIEQFHTALQSGSCSCEALTQFYLDRINTYDQSTGINAITEVNSNVLAEAKALDEEWKEKAALRPLHCVPLIVKDNYLTIGLQSAAGSKVFEGFRPSFDAHQVQRLKVAGAIILAKSNMAEWAFSPKVTISSLAGETRNPYNTEHTTAGSSGGTAAAVAANFGLIGLGTDTGNSIRGPSSHNALVGFRSTLGLTSRHGIFPLYLRNDVGGPMGRTVTDATKILQVIVGYDSKDPVTKYATGKVATNYEQYLRADGLQGSRIGVLRQLTSEIHPEIKTLLEEALLDMQKAGATVLDSIVIPDFASLSQNQWCAMFEHDLNQFLATLGPDAPAKDLQTIVDSGQFAPYIEGRLQYFLKNGQVPNEATSSCLDPYLDPKRIAFRAAIETLMDSLSLDALVYPSWNFPQAKIGDFDGYKGDNSQIIAPHTGQPAFTVPMGFVNNSLPAGLQFLGRMYAEPTLIRLTYAYEQATQHRLKGPKVKLAAANE